MGDESKTSLPISKLTGKSDHMKNCTAVNRWLLKLIGIWPINHQDSIIIKIFTKTQVVICYSFILFLAVPCALHTFLDEKDLRTKMKMIGPMIFYAMAVMKYGFLVARRNKIRNCFDHMFADWQQNTSAADHEIMLTGAKHSRAIASVCIIFSYSSAFFFRVIKPLSIGKHVTSDNITIRPLGSPVYKPFFKAIESPFYEIVFTMQTMATFIVYTITIAACSFAAIFVLHACGQLQIVMSKINSFVDSNECGKDVYENRIAEIVELHIRTLSFIKNIELMLNEVFLVEFVGSMINICLIGYYLLTELQRAQTIGIITYCVLLISFIFYIFIFCYIGEMLTQQGNKLSSSVKMMEWYRLPVNSARDLIVLIVMTNTSCNITAGKMAGLSYRSFSDVLKTSLGYFNLLRQTVL